MANPMPRIFVSHSSKDHDFCVQLVEDLRRVLGNEDAVWYDAHGGLHGGDVWWDKIERELSTRNIFLLVLSPDSLNSAWVNDELNIAWQRRHDSIGQMQIIPVLYRPCNDIKPRLRTLQFISFLAPKPYEVAFQEILIALNLPISPWQGDGIYTYTYSDGQTDTGQFGEVPQKEEAVLKTKVIELLLDEQVRPALLRTALNVAEMLTAGVACVGIIFVIIDIVQAAHGHSLSWWDWTWPIFLCAVGGTVYGAVEDKTQKDRKTTNEALSQSEKPQQTRRSQSVLLTILKITVIFIMLCNFTYITFNIIQFFQGHSPVWWVWAISLGALPLEFALTSYLSSRSKGEDRSFLNALANTFEMIMALTFVCNLGYIIVNIIQALLGYSPDWWIWVASLAALPLEVIIFTFFSSLEDKEFSGSKRQEKSKSATA